MPARTVPPGTRPAPAESSGPGAQAGACSGEVIQFNYDDPASKVQGTGVFVVIGQTPAAPLYLELIEPDPSFPAFQHCPRLAG